jgi:hypothetical protein
MTVTRRTAKTVAAGVAIIASALFAPAPIPSTNAMPPCCGVNLVTTYYGTADLTGSPVGQRDEQDCPFNPWGAVTPTKGQQDLLRDLRPGGTRGLAHHHLLRR